jgi:pimeloyl-ACP methyl ester carboxylesterase
MRKTFDVGSIVRRHTMPVLAGLVLLAVPFLAQAAPVQMKPGLLRLNANLEVPPGKTVADGVVILLHGMLSDDRQETIVELQKNLLARGVASLAITLSLGIDDRRGPRACNVVHDYALAGAQREVKLWVEWLKAQHVRTIDLLGFSRGGAQVAAMAPGLPSVRRLVLMAPTFATATEQEANYEHTFGHPLKPEMDAARKHPLQKHMVDFLTCKQAPVLGATFLDAYAELPPGLAARTGHPTLVVVAGDDRIVPDLKSKLPSDVRPMVIDGASHFFPDHYGEEAADTIASFVKADQAEMK